MVTEMRDQRGTWIEAMPDEVTNHALTRRRRSQSADVAVGGRQAAWLAVPGATGLAAWRASCFISIARRAP